MNYQNIYNSIIEKYKNQNLQKGQGIYLETHHIIPKCIGGTEEKSNLVNLPPKAHFICHILLPKIYKNDIEKYKKLYNALFAISVLNTNLMNREKLNSKKYEKIRSGLKWIRKGRKNTEETKRKCSLALKGKIPWNKGLTKETSPIVAEMSKKIGRKGRIVTAEHRKHLSEALRKSDKKRGKNNHWYGTHGPMGGKKHKQETIEKMRKINTGKNNHFFGKKHTQETRLINSQKVKEKWKDPEYRKKIIKSLKTKVKCVETGIIYASANIATRMTKIKDIGKCCRKEIETAGGFHWAYLGES